MASSSETENSRANWAPGSVRQRFLLLSFAVAIPALLGAAVLVADAYRFTRDQAERQLLETTRALSLVMDRQLGQSEAMLRALAVSPDIAKRDWRAFDAQARGATGPRGHVWIALYDLKGQALVNTKLPAGAAAPPIGGPVLAGATDDIRHGRTHYCDLFDGPVIRAPVLCVAIPVYENARLAYALAAVFEPRELDEILKAQRLPPGWYGTIIDGKGRLLARSVDADRTRGQMARANFFKRLRESDESVAEGRALDGVPVLSAMSRSRVSGWSFVVAMPRSVLTTAVQHSLALGVFAALMLSGLGILLALIAARTLTRPIELLAADARRLGHGDPVEPRKTGVYELDAVSRTLSQAASDLHTLERRLTLAKEAGRIGVWEWSEDNSQTWWSNSFYDIMGIDPNVAPNNRYAAQMVFEEDREAAVAAVAGAGEDQQFEATFRVRRSDGSERWLTSRGRCISLNPRRVVGITFDVTEMRALATALESANAQLENRVVERTAERDRTWKLGRDLFVVANLDASIVAVNPAWTDLLGWREPELVGKCLAALVHPDDAEKSAAQLIELANGRVAERFEHRLRHRDGRWRYIAWAAVPEAGQIHAVGRDVTDERSAADELASAQAALHEAQKLETLGQLTGGVAHDFNNLLTPIVGTLDLLRRRFSEDMRAVHLLDTAITSADRARTLVDRLLTFARRQTLKPRAVDVRDLVGGMVDLIRRSLGPLVTVIADVPGDLPAARVDPNQLELALLNLAVNARDAMPDGGKLTIAASDGHGLPAELPPGRYIQLSVSDEGEGMDADTLRRAVEPFFSTKGVGKGTGLGLSMAHGLAAQSGGMLTLRSTPGRGTTATLWLPVASEEAEAKPIASREPVAHHRGHILLVDDQADVRATAAFMLREIGCDVTEAGSGAEALNLLENGLQIDALITDHLMPVMQGAVLIDEVRRLRPGLPAMIVSGYAEIADAVPNDVQRLAKPFLSTELSAQLNSLLRTGIPAE